MFGSIGMLAASYLTGKGYRTHAATQSHARPTDTEIPHPTDGTRRSRRAHRELIECHYVSAL
jgi:hypothetical protein